MRCFGMRQQTRAAMYSEVPLAVFWNVSSNQGSRGTRMRCLECVIKPGQPRYRMRCFGMCHQTRAAEVPHAVFWNVSSNQGSRGTACGVLECVIKPGQPRYRLRCFGMRHQTGRMWGVGMRHQTRAAEVPLAVFWNAASNPACRGVGMRHQPMAAFIIAVSSDEPFLISCEPSNITLEQMLYKFS